MDVLDYSLLSYLKKRKRNLDVCASTPGGRKEPS